MPFKTPSKRGRSSTKAPFNPRRGLFEDGQWLCDCTPRKPALYLQVKKEGPNKGKHFYTCDRRKCSFFLFEHDAQPRERDALLQNNCRSENGIVARVQAKGEPPVTPSFADADPTTKVFGRTAPYQTAPPQQRIFRGLPRRNSLDSDSLVSLDSRDDDSQSLVGNPGTGGAEMSSPSTLRNSGSKSSDGPGHAVAGNYVYNRMPETHIQQNGLTTPSARRKLGAFLEDSDEEEFGGDDLDDPETERQLAAIADDSARKQQQFQTPSAQRTIDRKTATTRDGDGGLPTPATRRNGLLVAAEARGEPSAKRLRFTEDEDGGELEDRDPRRQLFPGAGGDVTPYRKANALGGADATTTSPFAKTPTSTDYPRIADEVMTLLAGQPLPDATRRDVRAALERHELRVRGVVRGRDVARATLEAREGRVAELQGRVVSLENARRLDRAQLRELSEGLLVRLSQQDE